MKKANTFLRLARRYGPVAFLFVKLAYWIWQILSEVANYHDKKLRVKV
ncbi:MAG: hypothetical protein RI979_1652 [Pseudomonadota bacterium]